VAMLPHLPLSMSPCLVHITGLFCICLPGCFLVVEETGEHCCLYSCTLYFLQCTVCPIHFEPPHELSVSGVESLLLLFIFCV
jgi:hypothetical protein